MEEYAGRVLADRYRLPLPPSDAYELAQSRAFDTYSGQEVLVRQVPLPEIVEAEVLDAEGLPEGFGGHGPAGGVRTPGGRTTRTPEDPAVRRAIEAAQAAAQIPDHPRLDQVFDVFAEGGSLWIVSEMVDAQPLAALMARAPLSPYRAAEVAADVLTALRALHAHGWVHRNITARTVLVCEDGRVVLTGLASGAAEEALCGYDTTPDPDAADPAQIPSGHVPELPSGFPYGDRAPGPRPGADAPRESAPPGPYDRPGTAGYGNRDGGGHGGQDGPGYQDAAGYGRAEADRGAARGGPRPPADATGQTGTGQTGTGQTGTGPRPTGPYAAGAGPAGDALGTGAGRPDPAAGQDGDTRDTRAAARAGAIAAYRAGAAGARAAARLGEERRSAAAAQDRDAQQDTAAVSSPGTGPVPGWDIPAPRAPGPSVPGGTPGAAAPGAEPGADDPARAELTRDDEPPSYGRIADPYGVRGTGPGAPPRPAGALPPASAGGTAALPPVPAQGALPPAGREHLHAPSGVPSGVPDGGERPARPDGTGGPRPHGRPGEHAGQVEHTGQRTGGWDAPGEAAPGRGPGSALAAERSRQARMAVIGAVTERWAPEQAGPVHENWQLAPPIGPATDLWGLGALLFRAVQGHAPYPEDSAPDLVQLVCSEPPAFAEDCGPLRPVVESLLRQDPAERPDFEELRGWLRSLIRSAPEPDVGFHAVATPPADAERLPIVRRRGEIVRRRRSRSNAAGRHKRGAEAAAPAKPRRLGRALVLLVLLGLAGAVAYAMVFLPKAHDHTEGGSADGGAAAGRPSASSPTTGGQDESPSGGGADDADGEDGKTPSSKAPQTGADLPEGYTLRKDDAGFQVAVPTGWQRQGKNSHGQVVYGRGSLQLIVVPGRDSTAADGTDPMVYQKTKEYELAPWRATSWVTDSGLQTIEVGGRTMAVGQFGWSVDGGGQVVARNMAVIIGNRYHVVQVRGPQSQQDKVDDVYEQASDTYRPTR